MKNYIKIIVLGSALSLGSCSDLLDTEPRQSLTPESAFSDLNGYESLLAAAYGGVRGFGAYG
jgi:hypothetical protein